MSAVYPLHALKSFDQYMNYHKCDIFKIMIKRHRINSTAEDVPVVVVDSHYQLCITFLCIVKYVPIMKNCIPRDIVKMILGYIKVDLTGKLQTTDGDWLQFKHASGGFWYWRLSIGGNCTRDYRPCVGCLKPIFTFRPDGKRFELTCPKCTSVATAHSACCGTYDHSISKACFDKFRSTYELPQ